MNKFKKENKKGKFKKYKKRKVQLNHLWIFIMVDFGVIDQK
jgi:hypothetical protein